MIRGVYRPAVPALSLSGHADSAPKGEDMVCAAASILMYTLLAATTDIKHCRAEPGARLNLFSLQGGEGDREAFRVIAQGFRLLARDFPENIQFEVRQ